MKKLTLSVVIFLVGLLLLGTNAVKATDVTYEVSYSVTAPEAGASIPWVISDISIKGSDESSNTMQLMVYWYESTNGTDWSTMNGQSTFLANRYYKVSVEKTKNTFGHNYANASHGIPEETVISKEVVNGVENKVFSTYEVGAQYTVTFDTNGGSTVASQTVDAGKKATRPEDPTKDGYTFIDWYMDPELNYEYDFGNVISENKTVYAKFVEDSKVIKSVNLTVEVPEAGTKVEKETVGHGHYSYTKPSIYPTVTSDNNNIAVESFYMDLTGEKDEYGYYPNFYGTFEKYQEYGILADIYVKEGVEAYLSKNLVVTINGKSAELNDYYYPFFRGAIGKIRIPGVNYNILDGANPTYIKGSNESVIVRADGEAENFVHPTMNDVVMSEDSYGIAVGSTILAIKPNYLDTLAAGTYTLAFIYNDGEVSTTLTVVDPENEEENLESQPTSDENNTEEVPETAEAETAATTSTATTKNAKNPGTGDNVLVWVGVGLISLGALIVVLFRKKK